MKTTYIITTLQADGMAHLSAAIYIHLPSSKHVTPLTHNHGDLPSWTWDQMESTSHELIEHYGFHEQGSKALEHTLWNIISWRFHE